jgi:RNA polymerase sigma-70 factor (ECF subfamily)
VRGADGRDDAELLAVLRDDPGAMRELYDRHAPWLILRLSRRFADPGVVDEVVQDTFVAIWKKPTAYDGSGEVAAWIWGIGIRRLIDRLRRRKVLAAISTREAFEPSAEERALLGVEYGDLAGALNRLSPELRAVVQATIVDGLTSREAGKLLGIPAGTVKTRMMRARAQMRGELA